MSQRKQERLRTCNQCKKELWLTSKALKEHAATCQSSRVGKSFEVHVVEDDAVVTQEAAETAEGEQQ